MTVSIYELIKQNPSAPLPGREADEIPGGYEAAVLRTTRKINKGSFVNHGTARIVRRFISNPTDSAMKEVEDRFIAYTAISLTDPVLSILSGMKNDASRLHDGAVKLCTQSGAIEAVKFGIALLGDERSRISELTDNDAEIIMTLSRCEEFTLYGAVALKNILPKEKADAALRELACTLHGWGKIAVMYELDYSLPEVRDWTLRYGCQNTIGLSYLANVCAIKGKMRSYLEELNASGEEFEPEHFTGITLIFKGLLEDDPNNDGIYEYPDAHESADLYKEIVGRSSADIKNKAADVLHGLRVKRIIS